jgi:hypothetical protein
MDTELTIQAAVSDWSSGWFSTMPGWLSLVFAVVIVLAVVALLRDWMHDRREFELAQKDYREPPGRRITHGRY